MTVRCLIVDDNRAFLEAARHLLETEGVAVVGIASNGAEGSRSSPSYAQTSRSSTSTSTRRAVSIWPAD